MQNALPIRRWIINVSGIVILCASIFASEAPFKTPYDGPRTERENVFAFTQKPVTTFLGDDRYEIKFAVKGYCDVTVAVVDANGKIIRHLASGVLGNNAPSPFQKSNLTQTIFWDGKDSFDCYVKEPKALKIRVSLGLKPQFDKRLGGTSAKNIPGYIFGIVIGPNGGYVFTKGNGNHGHVGLRSFDRDGNYKQTLVPPPANLPASKLSGYGFIEFEKGNKTIHSVDLNESVSRDGYVLLGVNGKGVGCEQPVMIGNKIYITNAGGSGLIGRNKKSKIYFLHTDGSSDIKGLKGQPFLSGQHLNPKLAASPNGKWIYMIGVGDKATNPVVYRYAVDGKKSGHAFIGTRKPGNSNKALNQPGGLDCDAKGRIYIADTRNNRIQIFSPKGAFLKSVKIDRPMNLKVHQKSGAIYVLHAARIKGKSISRLSKYASFDDLKPVFHCDHFFASSMAVDSWSKNPRIWLGGGSITVNTSGSHGGSENVKIWEDTGKTLTLINDFQKDSIKEAGDSYRGRWSGSISTKVICNPKLEQAYVGNRTIYDLKSGRNLGSLKTKSFRYDDLAVDGRGFLYGHNNPGLDTPCVWRVDTLQGKTTGKTTFYPEIPFDYGVSKPGKYAAAWKGVLPVRDQQGAKFFQDGLGVNIQGDVAVQSNIYYVPKMEDVGHQLMIAGQASRSKRGEYVGGGKKVGYSDYMRRVREKQKRGEDVYSIPRRPGIPLAGATVWTFSRTGELRTENAALVGKLIAGVQMDSDGAIYLVNSRPKMLGQRHFLSGHGGRFGAPKDKSQKHPFTATLIKSDVTKERISVLLTSSAIPLTPLPTRDPDLIHITFANVFSKKQWAWVDGAEWLYAGASPVVSGGCSCPTLRHHTDFFKRSFVPESYRHSIGVLDTSGNLIMHIGKYGNFDSASGANSKVKVGGDNIGMFIPRFISGTDKYLVYEDWGEKIVVLKLNYHAQETTAIKTK